MPQIQYRKDYRPYPFAIAECRLSFDIFEERVVVESRLQFRQNPKYEGHDANCVLDGVGLRVLHLELDGQPLEVEESSNKDQKSQQQPGYYRYDGQKLELLGTAGHKSFSFCAKVEIDPYNNKALEGFYRSGEILCTQNEPTGFRHITFYPDRPDVMSQFITEIRADKMRYPRLLSNGNLIKSEDLDGNRHYVCWEDPFAKPCYLYALVAGDLDLLEDHFTTRSGRNIDLRIYTDKGQTEKVRFAMQSLKQAMRWDEERFGREYDLDLFMIVAVDSFNFGAMENKGLNIFNSSLLFATEETATDATYENIAGVVAHEYFHNWTGNRITCRDWFQLTLKEGLTVYRDQLFSEDHFGHEVHRIEQVRGLRNSQYPEDAGPNRHPIRPESFIDINNFYTSTVYQKGAAVIRMMAIYLGEAGFRKGMDCYFERFDGQAVTCDDFVDALQTVGPDLTSLRRWYEQAGTPQLYVQSEWDGTSFTLKLRQENPNATKKTDDAQLAFPPLGFPLRYSLYSPAEKGKTPLKLCEHKTLIEERETIFTLRVDEPIHSAPVPSLMLDHCSPVQVHYDYSDEELLLLASADEDAFNRYEALQRYQKKLLLAQNGKTDFALNPDFIELVRGWLQSQEKPKEGGLSPRYLSYLLQPPSLQVLSDAQSPPRFGELHQVREAWCTELAQQLETEMLACYRALAQSRYERSGLAIGKRALRSTLLQYLVRLGYYREGHEYWSLAYEQYQNCDNMSDSYAALQSLAYWPDADLSEKALEQFRLRWKDEFLPMCRWFALQASVPHPQTVTKIRELEHRAEFQRENPNMLRSLYGVLGRNLVAFHHKGENGYEAYEFLARRIVETDRFNSMMSAGFADSFVAYKRLDGDAAQAMGKALKQILDSKGISERLYEIVSKTAEL